MSDELTRTFTAVSWTMDVPDQYRDYPPVKIDLCIQRDGTKLYAVRQAGACMDQNGEWGLEPQPSSRDEGFLKRFRFPTWHMAAMAIQRHITDPRGRIQN